MRGQGLGSAAVRRFSLPWLLAFNVAPLSMLFVAETCAECSQTATPFQGTTWGYKGEGKRVVCEGMLDMCSDACAVT